MPRRRSSNAKPIGITHFPPEQEALNQERVPPRGHAKEKGLQRKASPRKRAVRVAEEGQADPAAAPRFSSKGGKGGKTSGSRAGLLSSGQSDRGKKSRKAHPLDLL